MKIGTRTVYYGDFIPTKRAPDSRPDTDDVVLIHADAVKAEQDQRKTPQQVIRGRWPITLPSIPVGYDAWVNIYNCPVSGYGFEVVYEVKRDQRVYRRVVNYGSEVARESDWTEYVEPVLDNKTREVM